MNRLAADAALVPPSAGTAVPSGVALVTALVAGRRRLVLAAVLVTAGLGGSGCEGEPAGTIPNRTSAPPPLPAPQPPPPQPEPGQIVFDPSPPVPEDAHWGHEGTFELLRVENGSTEPVFADAVSTNPAVLELRPDGSLWDWRVVGPGVATIEIRYEDRPALSHEVRTPLPTHDEHHVMPGLRTVRPRLHRVR